MAAPMHSFTTSTAPALLAGSGWPFAGTAHRMGETLPPGPWFWALDPESGDRAPAGTEPVCLGLCGDPWASGLSAFAARRLVAQLAARPAGELIVVTGSLDLLSSLPVLQALARAGRLSAWVRIPSLDERVSAQVEPGGATPGERLSLVRALCEAGIVPGVVVPALQGVNDQARAVSAVFGRARSAGARRAVLAAVEPRRENAMAPDLYVAWLGLLAARLRRQHGLLGPSAQAPSAPPAVVRPSNERLGPRRARERQAPQLSLGLEVTREPA